MDCAFMVGLLDQPEEQRALGIMYSCEHTQQKWNTISWDQIPRETYSSQHLCQMLVEGDSATSREFVQQLSSKVMNVPYPSMSVWKHLQTSAVGIRSQPPPTCLATRN